MMHKRSGMLQRLRRDPLAAHEDKDAGAALVVVLGVMMVGAIMISTLAYVTMFSTKNTLENRVEMRALQSADAGLDLMSSIFEGKKYNELNTACGRTFVINNDNVVVTTDFIVKRGASTLHVACPDPAQNDIVLSVTVTSKATTASLALTGKPEVRSVAAVFAPTPPTMILDKAIFSEANLTITNNMIVSASAPGLNDANIYSNADIDCRTQSALEGSIYAAQGKVILADNCMVATTVWARDSVHITGTGAGIKGDLYSASTSTVSNAEAVRLANNQRVYGSVVTNGSIMLASNGVIDGSAFSGSGRIDLIGSNAKIGKDAYAKTGMYFTDGATVGSRALVTNGSMTVMNSGKVNGAFAQASGTIAANITVLAPGVKKPNTAGSFPNPMYNPPPTMPAAVGYAGAAQGTGLIQPPPREQMPQMYMGATELQKWQDAGWTINTATLATQCTGSGFLTYISNLPAGRNVAIFPPAVCTSGVQMDNATLTLKGDLAIVSPKGITSGNQLKVKSNNAAIERQLFWVMPADSPGVTWVGAPSGQTTPSYASAAKITLSSVSEITAVRWFIYTPGEVNWTNGISSPYKFKGQIYAGKATLQTQFPLQMNLMPVPSLASGVANPGDKALLNMSSRFDVPS